MPEYTQRRRRRRRRRGFVLVAQRAAQAEMASASDVRLRGHDFDTAECEYCRYYTVAGRCRVLAQAVEPEQVCDAYQGAQTKFKRYHVPTKDMMAFAKGMEREQPYKHFVVKGISTPVGPLLIIRDSMKPRPHTFSLDMPFSVEHTSREHHWTQAEVDRLIRTGSRQDGR